jgi:uncharacterized protein YdaU (DUF1376 family)
MHFYNFNIGDYTSHTRGLSLLEDLAYRRLIDDYYLNERPFNGCSTTVARSIGMLDQLNEVEYVLCRFFVKEGDFFVHKRIENDLLEYKKRIEQSSKAGKASAQSRKNKGVSTTVQQNSNDRSTTVQRPFNQPVTSNQEPIIKNTTLPHVRPEIVDNSVDNCPQSKPPRFYLKSDWVVEKTDPRVVSAARLISIAVDDIADHAFNQALLAFRGMSAQREFNDELAAINVFCAKYLKSALLSQSKKPAEQPKRELTREERRAEQDKKYENDETNFNRGRWNKNNQENKNV